MCCLVVIHFQRLWVSAVLTLLHYQPSMVLYCSYVAAILLTHLSEPVAHIRLDDVLRLCIGDSVKINVSKINELKALFLFMGFVISTHSPPNKQAQVSKAGLNDTILLLTNVAVIQLCILALTRD